MNKIIRMSSLGLLLSAASVAQAGVITFDNISDWQAVSGTPTMSENFEGFSSDQSFATGPVSTAIGSLEQTAGTRNFRNLVEVSPFSYSDNNGTNHASMFVESGEPVEVTFSFDSPLSAWFASFSGLDYEGLTIDLFDGNTLLSSFDMSGGNIDWGFALDSGESVSSMLFRATTNVSGQGGEGFGMDNIYAVSSSVSVPEPGSLALLGLGLIGLRLKRRK